MPNYKEANLEHAIVDSLKNQEYGSGNYKRKSEKEVLLIEDFKRYLSQRYSSEKLNDKEINQIINEFNKLPGSVYEANKTFFNLLTNGLTLKRDMPKKDLFIELLDYDNSANNIFRVETQFNIVEKSHKRIPDVIIFVNGFPLVVFELKNTVNESTTIFNAYEQLTKTYKTDIPKLFHYNAFIVISDGINNKYGSVFTPYEYFYSWRKVNSDDKAVDGINSLKTMIEGMFRKERLLAVIKNFIYFPDNSDKELKIVCRYPQFFGATNLYQSILKAKEEKSPKGGTYFGATGSGKSYTMLFLTRMLMKSKMLKSPTILIITDRTDLDDQLSLLFANSKNYIGDNNVIRVESRIKLRELFAGRESGGVFLTTIQKFSEESSQLSERSNIICISDEAHRSQVNIQDNLKFNSYSDSLHNSKGFAGYLRDSLPNAIYVGFTGTPIDKTLDVFGDIVDSYTMKESVDDGITVSLCYEGRHARISLNEELSSEIDKYYAECATEGSTEEQIDKSQNQIASMQFIIGDKKRISDIAKDFIQHYEKRVEEKATVAEKALFVCSSREIAYNFYKSILELRPAWGKEESVTYIKKSGKEVKLPPIAKVKMVMTRNDKDDRELFDLIGDKDYRRELDRQFKIAESNFKIAIVVDMWLTGFDVPELDTIYIDKPLHEHNLIQTISRVNRVFEGKTKGLVVDYFGIKKFMDEALQKYAGKDSDFKNLDDTKEIEKFVREQLNYLGKMFAGFDIKRFFYGDNLEKLECLKDASELILNDPETKKDFVEQVKLTKQAFNLCPLSKEITEEDKNYIDFYCAVRTLIFKLTKGDAPDTITMNKKVSQMVQEAITAEGVEKIFDGGEPIREILSDDYLEELAQLEHSHFKILSFLRLAKKSLASKHKISKLKTEEFSQRLITLVEKYNKRGQYPGKDQAQDQDIEDFTEIMVDECKILIRDIQEEDLRSREANYKEYAYREILRTVADEAKLTYSQELISDLATKIKKAVDEITQSHVWMEKPESISKLNIDIMIILMNTIFSQPLITRKIQEKVLDQAKVETSPDLHNYSSDITYLNFD